MSAGLKGIERTLLPAACLSCGADVGAAAGEPLVCQLCRSRWSRVPEPVCPRCGEPRSREDPECRICRTLPVALGRVRSAVLLGPAARRIVHLSKFEGWRRVAPVMARAMQGLAPLTPSVVLVPIPLGGRRLRSRGYNQAADLAAALASRGGYASTEALLRRTRETAPQSTLPPEGRAANLRGAFRAAGVTGRHVVLVDDVFTTGATVGAAAEALVAAGAATVEAVTFARALGPLAGNGPGT